MLPPDSGQHVVRHRLGIDRNARRAAVVNHAQLFFVQCVRPPALDGELEAAREIEAVFDGAKQVLHLRA